MVDASYDWFLSLVVDRRGLEEGTARSLSDGRIYTGFHAWENGLVDAIGGEDVARDWLFDEHDVDQDLPTEEWAVTDETGFGMISWDAMAAFIVSTVSSVSEKTLAAKGLTLDGLVSVWQPDRH